MVLAVIGFAPLLQGHSMRWWALGSSALCIAVALTLPAVFGPANRVLSRIGAWLFNWVVHTPITALMFYGVLTPAGVSARVLGRDALRLRFNAGSPSYWIPRNPSGPERGSMSRQF